MLDRFELAFVERTERLLAAQGRWQKRRMPLLVCLLVAQADVLVDYERRALSEEYTQNAVLTAVGSASIAAGVALAISKREDKKWLSFGLFTAAVGAINVGFGVSGLVQLAHERRMLADKLALEGEALRAYQQELVARHRGAATIYAMNFGLDVAYVSVGALLWVFGERFLKNEVLHGMGMAGVIQGAMLFIYDLAGWILAEQRGAVVARMTFSL